MVHWFSVDLDIPLGSALTRLSSVDTFNVAETNFFLCGLSSITMSKVSIRALEGLLA
jgi:hypothetical protein